MNRTLIALILAGAAAHAAADYAAPRPSILRDPMTGQTCAGESYWRTHTVREWWPDNTPCELRCTVGQTTVDGRKAIDCSPESNRSHGMRVGWKP